MSFHSINLHQLLLPFINPFNRPLQPPIFAPSLPFVCLSLQNFRPKAGALSPCVHLSVFSKSWYWLLLHWPAPRGVGECGSWGIYEWKADLYTLTLVETMSETMVWMDTREDTREEDGGNIAAWLCPCIWSLHSSVERRAVSIHRMS